MVGLIIDSSGKMLDGAPAQDAGQASIALDDGVMDLDDHFCSQLDHWAGCTSGKEQFHWPRRYRFRFIFSAGDEPWTGLQARLPAKAHPRERARGRACGRARGWWMGTVIGMKSGGNWVESGTFGYCSMKKSP